MSYINYPFGIHIFVQALQIAKTFEGYNVAGCGARIASMAAVSPWSFPSWWRTSPGDHGRRVVEMGIVRWEKLWKPSFKCGIDGISNFERTHYIYCILYIYLSIWENKNKPEWNSHCLVKKYMFVARNFAISFVGPQKTTPPCDLWFLVPSGYLT